MIPRGSRYSDVPVVIRVNQRGEHVATVDLRELPITRGVLDYVVAQDDRLDQLAARFYGDPTLYWCILDANPEQLDPFSLLVPGARIAIPANPAGALR